MAYSLQVSLLIYLCFLFPTCALRPLCFPCFLMSVLLNNTVYTSARICFWNGRVSFILSFILPNFNHHYRSLSHHREKLFEKFPTCNKLLVHCRVHKRPPPQNVAVEWLAFLIRIRANPGTPPENISPELGVN
jgi:hypothetical protein